VATREEAPTTSGGPPVLERSLGLYGATMVGVGAMVGAGIFVLSGVALQAAGPAAILAFLLNGLITTVTAFAFAELAAAFPESGGSYVFARKVFPIGGAFATGWVLWFAYVVACALYSLGFGSFLGYSLEVLGLLESARGWGVPAAVAVVVAVVALLGARGAGAGSWVALAKVVAFAILIAVGLVVLLRTGHVGETLQREASPAFPFGVAGVLAAMGYTFIALEGFEIIAAVAEEVKDPTRTIPRAMFLSIGTTLAIYLSLLFVMITVGGSGEGQAWRELGEAGETAVAVAAEHYAGGFGTVVVVVAGLLSTFTALVSTLLAASRVSFSMARDRALPRRLGRLGGPAGAPVVAIVVSGGLVGTLVVATGGVAVAGAAASLIFLLSFALVNAAGLLVRVRGGAAGGFQAPLYPFLPIGGVAACLALAGFQAAQVPAAAGVVGAWILLGVGVWRFWLRTSAETVSARAEALDANLIRLRGRQPLVLVPLANPARAEVLMTIAHALVDPDVGRVGALAIARHDVASRDEAGGLAAYDRTQEALRGGVAASCRFGRRFEGVVLVAPDVGAALARVVAERRPETIVLGMSELGREGGGTAVLEALIEAARSDVVVVRAPPAWTTAGVHRVLVPVAGGASHDPLRARVLGMLQRQGEVAVTLLRIVAPGADPQEHRDALGNLAEDLGLPRSAAVIEEAADPVAAVVARTREADLLVMGLGRRGARHKLFGDTVLEIVGGSACPVIAIAREE